MPKTMPANMGQSQSAGDRLKVIAHKRTRPKRPFPFCVWGGKHPIGRAGVRGQRTPSSQQLYYVFRDGKVGAGCLRFQAGNPTPSKPLLKRHLSRIEVQVFPLKSKSFADARSKPAFKSNRQFLARAKVGHQQEELGWS